MINMKRLSTILLGLIFMSGCEYLDSIAPDDNTDKTEQTSPDNSTNDSDNSSDPNPIISGAFTTANIGHAGLSYLWDSSIIPEITINVSLVEWNNLLKFFDQDKDTKEYIKCDITYRKGTDCHTIKNSGIRLRGNTSRRRPEAILAKNTKPTQQTGTTVISE